ncbi:MAG: hypothetical protein ACRDIE_23275, partial [Chloroflexota bacterium]
MGVRRRIRSREERGPISGSRPAPSAAGRRPAEPNHIAGMLLQMQRTAGNAAVNAFLQRQALTQAPAEGAPVGASRSVGSAFRPGGVTIQRNGVKDLISQHEKAQVESGKSQTSGGSTTAPTRTSLATKLEKFNAAKEKHTADRAALKKHVERGLAMGRDKENRLVNSCEWVMKGKTKLYAITPTGDSAERLTAAGKNPTKDEAFFPRGSGGPGDIFSSQEEYNYRDLADNTGVILDDDGKVTSGWNNAGYVAVANAQTVTQD